MKEFVGAGAGFCAELVKDPVEPRKPVEPEIVYMDSGTQTQEIPVMTPDPNALVRELSWEQIVDAKIPARVKEVAFTMEDKDLTPEYREELQADYPGVALRPLSLMRKEAIVPEEAKPKGVSEMIIELDEAEVAQNPLLDQMMRERYPWATIESRPIPSISRKRVRRTTESRSSSPRRPDPLEHLRDLAEYAVGPEPPAEEEFGYRYTIGKGWDTLSYPRKLEIAHARAIQHHHGKATDGPGCPHCVEKGYQCKVYLPQLCNLSHIAFGHSCQNCRLQGIQCGLPAAVRERTLVPTESAALRLDTQNVPRTISGEAAYTPPPTTTTNTPKQTLISRITYATPSDSDATTPFSRVESNAQSILTFADNRDYPIHGNARRVLYAMYVNLIKKGETLPYGATHTTLGHHYDNIVTLYILTYLREEFDLAFLVLLRFQHTSCDQAVPLPELETALQAFLWLPSDAPLCQWIIILYGLQGTTEELETWRGVLSRANKGVRRTEALEKLMHGVERVRGSSGRADIWTLLDEWCKVHDHADGSAEDDACAQMQSSLRDIMGLRRGTMRAVEDTRVDEFGRTRGDSPGVGSSTAMYSSFSGVKRNAEDDISQRPFKYRGSARGRGEGRGRGRGSRGRG